MKKIFVCWAKDLGREMAETLVSHLKQILPDVEFVIATELISGQPWVENLMKNLVEANAVIVCLTAGAQESPWLNHEIGAAAGKEIPIYPVLMHRIDEELTGPLGLYQVVRYSKKQYRTWLIELAAKLGLEIDLGAIDSWWASLGKQSKELLYDHGIDERPLTARRYFELRWPILLGVLLLGLVMIAALQSCRADSEYNLNYVQHTATITQIKVVERQKLDADTNEPIVDESGEPVPVYQVDAQYTYEWETELYQGSYTQKLEQKPADSIVRFHEAKEGDAIIIFVNQNDPADSSHLRPKDYFYEFLMSGVVLLLGYVIVKLWPFVIDPHREFELDSP